MRELTQEEFLCHCVWFMCFQEGLFSAICADSVVATSHRGAIVIPKLNTATTNGRIGGTVISGRGTSLKYS